MLEGERTFVERSDQLGRRAGTAGRPEPKGQGEQRSEWDSLEADVVEFLDGRQCRRVVLDDVMDGRKNRLGCEGGEAKCDVCEAEQAAVLRMVEETDGDDDEEAAAVEENVRRQMQLGEAERTAQRERAMAAWRKWERTEEMVQQLRGVCMLCRRGSWRAEKQDGLHAAEECRLRGSELWRRGRAVEEALEQLLAKRMMQKYAGCFNCAMPQEVCGSWTMVEGEGRTFRQTVTGQYRCELKGVVFRALGEMAAVDGEWFWRALEAMMGESGAELDRETDEWVRWLGRRRKEEQLEGSNLWWFAGLLAERVAEDN